MAVLKELAGKAAAVMGCAVARVEGVKTRAVAVKACALVRAEAAKSCAMERADAVMTCALERVQRGVWRAQLRFQLAGNRVQMWVINARQARADKISLDRFNRDMYEIDVLNKKSDYELRLKEYRQWRLDQAEIACRDIFKRMQQQGMVPPDRSFPLPLREGLYDIKPSPLLPVKPVIQTYAEFLQESHKVVGLFDGTIRLFVKPVYGVASLLSAIAIVAAGYEEMQTPGTIMKHVRVMSTIFKGEQPPASSGDANVDECQET